MEKDNIVLFILAIVGVVAVVGIVAMTMNESTASAESITPDSKELLVKNTWYEYDRQLAQASGGCTNCDSGYCCPHACVENPKGSGYTTCYTQ